MFVDILNSSHSRRLMRSGRQVSKTVTIAADLVTEATLEPFTQAIYANASALQTSSFSTAKLDPFMLHSPVVYHNMMIGKNVINNVLNKRFANMSNIKLTYIADSADRIRGDSAQSIRFDEVQDILYDAVIDAEECLSAAEAPRFTYAGTSKSVITTLEFLWDKSTMKEWIIPCQHCGIWNRPSLENIGKHGLICKKCGKPISTRAGHWHSFAPPREDGLPHFADGYWIPQIIMPMHCEKPEKWAKLLEKLENYPSHKFLNEVMGIPYGEGDSPITEEMLRAMCIEDLPMGEGRNAQNSDGATYLIGGIDWGGGGMDGTSRTVLSIYAVYPERPEYRKVFGKIYTGKDPMKHVQDIAHWLRRFQCTLAYGDHGGGNFAMSELAKMVPDMRIVPVMYSDQSSPCRWDNSANRYTVNRTMMIDAFFTDVKRGQVRCFNWNEFQPFARDILNVREEVIGEELGKSKRVWRHYPSKPDDSLHSMVFGWFGCRVAAGLMEFYVNPN